VAVIIGRANDLSISVTAIQIKCCTNLQLHKKSLRNQKCLKTALGSVYTCDSASDSPSDSVYDLLHKVVSNLFYNQFFSEMCLLVVIIGVQRIIKTLNPFVCKLRTESYVDSHAESDTCRRPLRNALKPAYLRTTILSCEEAHCCRSAAAMNEMS
jgi:hypothetical protein